MSADLIQTIQELLRRVEILERDRVIITKVSGGGASTVNRVKLHNVWWEGLGTKKYIRIRINTNQVEDHDGPWPGEDPDGEIWLEVAKNYGDFTVQRN